MGNGGISLVNGKGFRIFSILITAMMVVGLWGGTALAAQARPIKIGAVLGLTGDIAGYGIPQRRGLELARDMINAEGGVLGRPIEIIFEDSRGDRIAAINGVQKLINRDRVLAIIGPTLSAEMFAAGPAANQRRVVIMGVSNTAEGIRDIGPYVFRSSVREADVLPHTIRVSHEHLGYETAALLYSNNDDFSRSGADTFRAELERIGVRIVATETFSIGDTDFRAQLTKVAAAQPDVLVVSTLYREAALLLRQARQLGLDQPVIGGNGFNSPEFITNAGPAADGAIVGSPWFVDRDHPGARRFVEAYQARYGLPPDQFAAQAFDGLFIFAEAIRIAQNGDDRAAFQRALGMVKNYDGVTGLFSFDERGEPHMAAHVLRIENGVYVPLK